MSDKRVSTEQMRAFVNRQRDVADEAAARYGCDDYLHPAGPQQFRDYVDFIDRVARPLVEADGDDDAVEQAAMKLYRTQSPYSICLALVMMDNRLRRAE